MQDASGNLITYLGNLENAYFGNCIIYGNLEEEFLLAEDESVEFNHNFDHCIIRTQSNIAGSPEFLSCLPNTDPLFINSYNKDYRIDTLSPAIDYGNLEVINSSVLDLTNDIIGNSRISDIGPDLGAYEYSIEEIKFK